MIILLVYAAPVVIIMISVYLVMAVLDARGNNTDDEEVPAEGQIGQSNTSPGVFYGDCCIQIGYGCGYHNSPGCCWCGDCSGCDCECCGDCAGCGDCIAGACAGCDGSGCAECLCSSCGEAVYIGCCECLVGMCGR